MAGHLLNEELPFLCPGDAHLGWLSGSAGFCPRPSSVTPRLVFRLQGNREHKGGAGVGARQLVPEKWGLIDLGMSHMLSSGETPHLGISRWGPAGQEVGNAGGTGVIRTTHPKATFHTHTGHVHILRDKTCKNRRGLGITLMKNFLEHPTK